MSQLAVALAVLAIGSACANGPAARRRSGLGSGVTADQLDGELQEAMSAVLGCGGTREMDRFAAIQRQLEPMWRTMPLNQHGRVDQKTLRYMAHRFFMQQSNFMVKGFDSATGATDILSERVPAFVEKALAGQHDVSRGFALEDAVAMVAMLEQLIFDSESVLLSETYHRLQLNVNGTIGRSSLDRLTQMYAVEWLIDGTITLDAGENMIQSSGWRDIREHVSGQVQSFDWQRAQSSPMNRQLDVEQYSFDEVHDIVGSLSKSFGSFWESECQRAKNQLVIMDPQKTGRVKLADFYRSSNAGGFHFEETEDYLRDLGALDESSSWRGKQVIVANYLQGASNCVTSTEHYLLCCTNECEHLMGELEADIGAPSATPEQLLTLAKVKGADFIDGKAVNLGALTQKLDDIASTHGGKVPLHGRLFAQWLHYAFPHECPFPHKTGMASKTTPEQFSGRVSVSSPHDAAVEAASFENATAAVEDYMSQWSHDEEHYADYSRQVQTGTGSTFLGAALLIAGAAYFVFTQVQSGQVTGLDGRKVMKSHLV